MTEENVLDEILVVTKPVARSISNVDSAPRRGSAWETVAENLSDTQSIGVSQLQQQVNIFLQQMNIIMSDTPEKIGGFHLAEFEVSAEIKIEAKGEVKLALLASGEVGGGIGTGLKFVFKRA